LNLEFREFNHEDIDLFFKVFDTDQTNRITLRQFSDIVLPISPEYARLVTERAEFFSRRGDDFKRYFNCDTRMDY
jgi:hypothetical protein